MYYRPSHNLVLKGSERKDAIEKMENPLNMHASRRVRQENKRFFKRSKSIRKAVMNMECVVSQASLTVINYIASSGRCS